MIGLLQGVRIFEQGTFITGHCAGMMPADSGAEPALVCREKTGEGCLLLLSMLEALMQYAIEPLAACFAAPLLVRHGASNRKMLARQTASWQIAGEVHTRPG